MKTRLFFICTFISASMWVQGTEISTRDTEVTTTSPMELACTPPISINDLPMIARQTITTYFGLRNVLSCQQVSNGKRYLVRLKNKKRVFFDEAGNWILIDCKKQNVPELLVPIKVRNQVAEKFGPYVHVVKISRKDDGKVKVGLSNSVKMTFEI